MPADINKVFVYGTLLQGEILSHHMSDCKLLKTLEIPGSLYDTNRGYPTAVFRKTSKTTVHGELYIMDNPASKLRQLDELEMTQSDQYSRVDFNFQGVNFFSYEADSGLQRYCRPMYQIDSGDWRRHLSVCFSDPIGFALAFEDRQKYLYREPISSDADGSIYLKGDVPMLISAPHASVHERMGKPKRQEFFTAALSVIMHSLTDCHTLYTNRMMKSDPNYYDDSPYKTKLDEIIEVNDIKYLIDLHGTGPERDHDIYPGIGVDKEFLLGNNDHFNVLGTCAELNGISIGGLDVFPAAKQMTVTKYAARVLGIPSVQIEINRRLREPEKAPQEFIKLIKFLRDYIEKLSYLVG